MIIPGDAHLGKALDLCCESMPYHPRLQRQAVCTAYSVSESDVEAWNGYVKDLGELTLLSEIVQALVADPKRCQ